MDVFGVRQVGDEEHDQAQGDPPADVLANQQCLLRPAEPGPRKQISKRLPVVCTVQSQPEGGPQKTEPDMCRNKDAHDQRVACLAFNRFGMQQCAFPGL
ncbi:MAG TPA: hypothetical protein DCY42_00550 [Chloroflexi bacterium]|nr:hypothetical protein [Chloroflexota bacterium]